MKRLRTILLLAAEAEISLDQQQSLLNGALREQFGLDDDHCQRFWLREAFTEYVIASGPEGKLYQIPYTMTGDEVKLGEAQEVTTAYVPVAEACEFVTGEADGASPEKFPIVAVKSGWARGTLGGQAVPHYYPPAFVKTVAEAINGKPFGRRHPDQKGPDPTGATDPSRIAGWLDPGVFDGQRALTAINLFTAESDLRSRLDDARKNDKLGLFGTSMLALVGWRPGVVEGKQCMVAESLESLYSIDLCARGGAGGEFLVANSAVGAEILSRQTAAINDKSTAIAPQRGNQPGGGNASRTEGATMKESLRKLLEALRLKNANRAAELSLEFATTAEADYPALMTKVTEAFTATESTQAVTAESAAGILAEAKRIQSRSRIETKLTDSKLPEPAKKLAREHLETALAAEADLKDEAIDTEITRVRTAFAAFESNTRVRPGSIAVLDSVDKLALAMEAAIGVKDSMGKGVPAFRGIREAYVTITGDHDLSKLRSGAGFTGHLLASEAVATGDFPNLLLNSMTKRLLQDYKELAMDGLGMLYTKATINDYKTQDRVRDGYFGELATVAENGTYQEIAKPTDEKVSYSVGKRGQLLTISEETIRNDDLGAIARFPNRLARAGRFTLKQYITNFFKNNPNYTADSVAWFHATHANLATTALSQDSLIADEVALLTQTEKDSGEPLGLSLDWIMVPPALAATARQINQTNTAGSNAFYQRFGVNNERIIVNEKLTDTNDYYYGTSQDNAPFLEIGFLDGIEEPQIFLANQPTVGTQFTADQLQYKVKMVFNGAIVDFRGAGKHVVA
jgi:hypothetical protein